jgi:hypothetical protein
MGAPAWLSGAADCTGSFVGSRRNGPGLRQVSLSTERRSRHSGGTRTDGQARRPVEPASPGLERSCASIDPDRRRGDVPAACLFGNRGAAARCDRVLI